MMEDFLLEPRHTHSLKWAWKHSLSQDWWWELLGSLGQQFYDQCSDLRVCQNLFLGHWSIEWPGPWYCEHEWLWRTILLTLGLHYHKGSGGRGMGPFEDQVALIVPDPTKFSSQVAVILGTLTIYWIINVIKESEIDELSISLNGLRISYLLVCHQAKVSIKRETARNLTGIWPRKLSRWLRRKKYMLFL